MGNTIWIESRGRPGHETHSDMGKLRHLEAQLDALGDRLGVTKLSDFYDFLPLLEANQGDGYSNPLPEPHWSDSVKGLESVKALRACLEKDFSALKWMPDEACEHWPNDLLDELRLCESVLEEAIERGQPFRLMIVP